VLLLPSGDALGEDVEVARPAPEYAGWLSKRLPSGIYVVPVVREEMLANGADLLEREFVKRVPISLYSAESGAPDNSTRSGVPL
jgi:hypothetical protein